MPETRLHYIYDPLCGWCYGVAPLVQAARDVLPVVGHGGGMLTGATRKRISPAWREYVRPNDQRITEVTGQVFGEAYLNGLLKDHTAWLDSEPPTAAVLAAEQIEGRGLDMLARLHIAHYLQGLRVADTSILVDLATGLGLNEKAFKGELRSAQTRTAAHFAESRLLLEKVGGRGFPTFILESEGGFRKLDHTPFLGDRDGWSRSLRVLSASGPAISDIHEAGCADGSCSFAV